MIMLLGPVFARFAAKSPISVTVQGTLEYALTQGQRVSNSMKSQDFREEVGVHHTPEHLAPEAVLDGVSLQECDREASEPAEVIGQSPLARAAVVLPEGHVQHPVQRLDPPVPEP